MFGYSHTENKLSAYDQNIVIPKAANDQFFFKFHTKMYYKDLIFATQTAKHNTEHKWSANDQIFLPTLAKYKTE